MPILRSRHLALAVLFGILMVGRAGAQARWATLDEFFTRGVRLNAQELSALGRGETVARMLATGDGDDIAVFRAVQVKVAIPSGSSFRAEPRSGGVEESRSSR